MNELLFKEFIFHLITLQVVMLDETYGVQERRGVLFPQRKSLFSV